MTGHLTWKSPVSSIIYIPYTSQYAFGWEQKIWSPEFAHVFFHNCWHYSIYIAAFYIVTIFVLQRYMKNRKPVGLKSILISWNTGLALFSFMGTIRMASEFHYVLSTRNFQDSVCLAMDPTDISTLWAFLFVLSKVFELMDTIFLILKKKPVIFLHWYHHAIVLVYCWHSAIMLTAASRWFIMMNYAIHSIMYTYYGLTAYGFCFPKVVSMSITTLQTTQMIVGVYISCYVALAKWYYHKVCHQSDSNLLFCFGIYISFAILFMNFFVKTYMSKGSPKKKIM